MDFRFLPFKWKDLENLIKLKVLEWSREHVSHYLLDLLELVKFGQYFWHLKIFKKRKLNALNLYMEFKYLRGFY